jgi:hypothetical protein
MRRRTWWTLLLLAVPHLAAADGASGQAAGQMLPGRALGLERTGAPTTPPSLDLQIDSMQLPSQAPPDAAHAIEPERADRYTGADQSAADRGFSFGVELKPRTPIGRLAREGGVEHPSLGDRLQRLIERPTFGVRGRYRF